MANDSYIATKKGRSSEADSFKSQEDKNWELQTPHMPTDESGTLTMTKKCVRGKNWNKDTQKSCNWMA